LIHLFIEERQKDRETERQKDRKTERQEDRKTERQKDRKTERKKDRKTEKQKDRKTFIHCRTEMQLSFKNAFFQFFFFLQILENFKCQLNA
jgi:hypothetical protein